jgi:predicted DsbA family dithiol-disulfide isomerase
VTTIEVFADIVCPFTHVGLLRLVEARRNREVHAPVRVRAWPLEWINGTPLDVALVAHEVEALRAGVAPGLFAGFDPTTWPRTSLPAFGLAAAAYVAGEELGETVSLALRHALFEEGRDIGDPAVVGEIGKDLGVSPLDLTDTITEVRLDWERGRERNVAGSPHFFVGKRDWFCPSLRIRHEGAGFEIAENDEARREFYATALHE